MSATALALVLLAAFLHAVWNYHLKRAASDRTFWLLAYTISACGSLPVIWCFAPESLSQITAKGWALIALSAPIHVGYARCFRRAIATPTIRWSIRRQEERAPSSR